MRLIKRMTTFVIASVLFLAALTVTAGAATYEVEPGDVVTVEIPVNDGISGQGTLVFSDTTNFTCTVGISEGIGSITYNQNNGGFSYATADPFSGQSLVITVEVSDSAQPGDSCTISAEEYMYCDDLVDFAMTDGTLDSQTVVVVAEPTPTSTPEPTPTSTPEPTPTSTPEPTATSTPEPTATSTPEATEAPTEDVTSTPAVDDGADDTPPTGGNGIALWVVLVLVSACGIIYMTKEKNNN